MAARPSRPEGGFSLVELLVIVAIAATMAAVAIPAASRMADRSQDAAVRAALADVRSGVVAYLNTNNGRPTGGGATVCFRSNTDELDVFMASVPEGETLFEVLPGMCDPETWELYSLDDSTTPAAVGSLAGSVRVHGYVAASGNFCLNGYNTAAPDRVFHLDSQRSDSVGDGLDEGPCAEAGWAPTGEPAPGVDLALPSAPQALTLTSIGDDSVVQWSGNASNGYGVIVTGPTFNQAVEAVTAQTEYTLPSTQGGLEPGTYSVTVYGRNGDGEGPRASITWTVEP